MVEGRGVRGDITGGGQGCVGSLTGDVTAPRLLFFHRERSLTGSLTVSLSGILTGDLTGSVGGATAQQCVDVAGRYERIHQE